MFFPKRVPGHSAQTRAVALFSIPGNHVLGNAPGVGAYRYTQLGPAFSIQRALGLGPPESQVPRDEERQ